MSIETKAFDAYSEDRQQPEKYWTLDRYWCDWYVKGYRQAEQELKDKAIVTYCACCEGRESECPKETCIARNEFIQRLNEK